MDLIYKKNVIGAVELSDENASLKDLRKIIYQNCPPPAKYWGFSDPFDESVCIYEEDDVVAIEHCLRTNVQTEESMKASPISKSKV